MIDINSIIRSIQISQASCCTHSSHPKKKKKKIRAIHKVGTLQEDQSSLLYFNERMMSLKEALPCIYVCS